jgi:hypothetical protein
LTAQLTAADIQTAGVTAITVFTPAPGGGSSNALNLAIDNPVPAISSISPSSAIVGDPALTLTVNGTNFVAGSAVQWNGTSRTTTFVNETQLTAQITAADLLSVGTASVTVLNPAPGGGASGGVSFSILASNSVPLISSLSPDSAIAGSAAFTLMVNGSNFISDSVVRWNGAARLTTFVSAGQLTAQITAADIASGGTFQVSVFTPPPGGGESNVIDFTVITPNPLPAIVSLSPSTATAGGAAFTLTINGSNFANGAIVKWDGSDRITSFSSSSQLQAQITAADIQSAGSHLVTVFNPAPGGGTSNAVSFEVNNPTVLRFSLASYQFSEATNGLEIAVVRSGDTSGAVSVDFLTDDSTVFIPCGNPTGGADQRCDFATKGGTLMFAAGETSKTILLLNTDDAYVEGPETFTVTLTNAEQMPSTLAPVTIGSPAQATIVILDNDSIAPTTNPIDEAQYFVNQHYMDFLSRLPDAGGLGYWTSEITACGNDVACINHRRIGVSAAFFAESEFQLTGYVVYRLYKASFGTKPNYQQFMPDRSQLVGGPQLAASTLSFANRFTSRPGFKAAYPDAMTSSEFVNKLFDTAQLMNNPNERQQAITDLTNGTRTRTQILLDVIEISEFKEREFNSAFVLMEYFGYLRRDPDQAGFDFWLNVLNNREPNNYRGMVCSFITSQEFQQRFSSVTTHSNSDCAPQ